MDKKDILTPHERIIFDFDPYVLTHLKKWLETAVNGDRLRELVYARMTEYVAADVEAESCQGWWNVFDRSGCDKIERAYIRHQEENI